MPSDLEDLFLAELHRLCPNAPEPQRQVKLIEGRKFSVDFYWPAFEQIAAFKIQRMQHGVVVEIDGLAKQAGGGKHMRPADYEKINLLQLEGYTVLRYLGSMLRNDPVTCISQVAQALGVKMRQMDV